MGLAYRDFACLGFVFLVPAIGYETWGAHHRQGSVRDKIGICLPVLHAGLLRGKKEPAKTKWY